MKNHKIEKIEAFVINWAEEKNLTAKENSFKQFIKTVEEVGEIASALAKSNQEALKDGIGDVMVTLAILAKQNDLDLSTCFNYAWNEIKDRKGETVNGVFIKNDDSDKYKEEYLFALKTGAIPELTGDWS